MPYRPPPRRRVGITGRNSNLEPGDIITEIKMQVGQNGKNAENIRRRIPPPVDISSAPLPGVPRGPPLVSNIVTRPSESDTAAKPRAVVPSATLTVQDTDKPQSMIMRSSSVASGASNSDALVSPPDLITSSVSDVIVRDIHKNGSSIDIKWDSGTSNILGFRVIYRLFGKAEFKQGPPLAPSEREFRIKNVPSNVSA